MSITVPIEAYRGSIRPVDLGGLIDRKSVV